MMIDIEFLELLPQLKIYIYSDLTKLICVPPHL